VPFHPAMEMVIVYGKKGGRAVKQRPRPPLASVEAPHSHQGAMDVVRGAVERVDLYPNHVVVTHLPWQPHATPPPWNLAPVRDQGAGQRLRQADLHLVKGVGPDGDGDEFDLPNRPPAHDAETRDEDSVLVGADYPATRLGEREIVVGEGARREPEANHEGAACSNGSRKEDGGKKAGQIDRKRRLVASVGNAESAAAAAGFGVVCGRCHHRAHLRGYSLDAQSAAGRPFARAQVAGELLQNVVGIILLLLICLLVGLFAGTKTARKMITYLERGVLQYIPGYMLIKTMAENAVGLDSHDELKVALIRTDSGWQLGFIVDKVNDSLFVVFAPDAPNTMSGSVYYVEIENMRHIDITQKEARQCIRKLGLGSGQLFRDKLPVL